MSCSSSVLAPELLIGMLALLSAPLTLVLFTQSLCDFAHAWRQSKGSSRSRQLVNLFAGRPAAATGLASTSAQTNAWASFHGSTVMAGIQAACLPHTWLAAGTAMPPCLCARPLCLQAEVMLVEEGTTGWRDCVQRSTVAVERLLLHGWIAPGSVVRWLFSRQAVGMQSASDPLQSLQCWDLLQAAMRRAQQLTQVSLA